jgi:hypothetical protein
LETFFSRRGVKKVELGIKKAANLEWLIVGCMDSAIFFFSF